MGYVLTAFGSAFVGAILMSLLCAWSRSNELSRVYEQGVKEGCRRTWAQVRRFNQNCGGREHKSRHSKGK